MESALNVIQERIWSTWDCTESKIDKFSKDKQYGSVQEYCL